MTLHWKMEAMRLLAFCKKKGTNEAFILAKYNNLSLSLPPPRFTDKKPNLLHKVF